MKPKTATQNGKKVLLVIDAEALAEWDARVERMGGRRAGASRQGYIAALLSMPCPLLDGGDNTRKTHKGAKSPAR